MNVEAVTCRAPMGWVATYERNVRLNRSEQISSDEASVLHSSSVNLGEAAPPNCNGRAAGSPTRELADHEGDVRRAQIRAARIDARHVRDCDMHAVIGAAGLPLSAESTISCGGRSEAEHGWFGLDHRQACSKGQLRAYWRLKTTRRSRRPAVVRASC